MTRRLAFTALFVSLALSVAPARAGAPLWRLECKAHGTAAYVGDAEGGNVWLDLKATGSCAVYPGGSLTVTLTAGEVDASLIAPAVCPMTMRPKLILQDATGTSHVLWQSWLGNMPDCFLADGHARGVVQNSVGAPVGTWQSSVQAPNWGYSDAASFSMKWTFLVWPWK